MANHLTSGLGLMSANPYGMNMPPNPYGYTTGHPSISSNTKLSRNIIGELDELWSEIAGIKNHLALILPIVERDPDFAHLKATYDAYCVLKEIVRGTEGAKDGD